MHRLCSSHNNQGVSKSLINTSIIICKIAVNGKKEIENSKQFFLTYLTYLQPIKSAFIC